MGIERVACELVWDEIPIYGMTTAACAAAVQDRVSLKRPVELSMNTSPMKGTFQMSALLWQCLQLVPLSTLYNEDSIPSIFDAQQLNRQRGSQWMLVDTGVNTAEPNKDSTTATESQLHRVYLVSINCWLDWYLDIATVMCSKYRLKHLIIMKEVLNLHIETIQCLNKTVDAPNSQLACSNSRLTPGQSSPGTNKGRLRLGHWSPEWCKDA